MVKHTVCIWCWENNKKSGFGIETRPKENQNNRKHIEPRLENSNTTFIFQNWASGSTWLVEKGGCIAKG